jgi:hypothetical protein
VTIEIGKMLLNKPERKHSIPKIRETHEAKVSTHRPTYKISVPTARAGCGVQ